jgi:hypothetical protein
MRPDISNASLRRVDMNEFEVIYEKWHDYAKGRDVPSLIDLYAEDAVFESPLVPAILDQDSGVLRGRAEILRFLQEGTKRRPTIWFAGTGQASTSSMETPSSGNIPGKLLKAIKSTSSRSCRSRRTRSQTIVSIGDGSAATSSLPCCTERPRGGLTIHAITESDVRKLIASTFTSLEDVGLIGI